MRGRGILLLAAGVTILLPACMASPEIRRRPPFARACAAVRPEQHGGRVDWYHPVGVRDGEKLDDWCHAVGPVVIDSLPPGSFGPLRPSDSLTVAAWNTDAGSGDLMAFLGEELGLRCDGNDSSLRPGQHHFVLLVQEALRRSNDVPDVPPSWATPPPVAEETHPGERLDVLEVATACGLAAFYAPAGRNGIEPRDGLREDKGNAILATVPLSDFIVIELPYEAARRVVPVATIRNSVGDSLRVGSVHLITTPPPARMFLTGNSARMRQALALADALREVEEARGGADSAGVECGPICDDLAPARYGTSTLVGGDMNAFSRRETALRQLRVDFPDSPPLLPLGTRGPFPTDHLLFSQGGSGAARILPSTFRRIADTYYSDHNPIVVLFGFR